ncbi:succinylglutamate desuccinylase [Kangiella sp. TOML190]|uniref:succinylglutamate desuccinylase n=1 Tax=Kangiella sp. TOML190 TaxID=2931351 RepID=UPI002041C6B0|nr:succinylglutamate desuccinylase [Kangiella sp. TOML190]
MNPSDYCKHFDLIEFVRENPERISPFSLDLEKISINFRQAGIIEFLPKQSCNVDMILSAGVHGNETAPIEIVNDLVKKIMRGELELKVNLLVMIGNPKAMLIQERFTGFNLNRLFNGEWKNYLDNPEAQYEAKRAALLEQEVKRFYTQSQQEGLGHIRIHYDLHTAIKPSLHQKFAIYPYLHERKHSASQIKFLLSAGVDTVLLYHKPSTTFSYHSSFNYQAHAFTLELGKVRPFGENNREDFALFEQKLEQQLAGQYIFEAEPDISQAHLYQVKKELIKNSEMDELAFDSANTANFTQFNQDELLLDAGKHSYLTEQDGEAIVFSNNKVPVGQRMGLVVVKQ